MAHTSYQQPKTLSRFRVGEKSKKRFRKKRINILGAGISGLVAGITLARHGFCVRIFEKRPRVGSFIEKDIHTLRNYSYNYDVIKKYRSLGIKISHFYPIYKEIRFFPSSEKLEIYSKKKPLFYNIIRGYKDKRSLDIQLFEEAKKLGVEIVFGQQRSLEDKDIDMVATGARYRKGIIYGCHYKNVSMEPNTIYFFLGSNRAFYGYSYINPFEKEASLAIASPEREKKEYLIKRFSRVKENKIIKQLLRRAEVENDFFGFGFFDLPETAIKKGKLYVGEAAGFLDATTGFGVHYAILSGYLAAKSIIERKNYDELWKKTFGDELKKRYLRRMAFKKIGTKGQNKVAKMLVKKYGKIIAMRDYIKIYDQISKEVSV
ncbi:hypothetical protein DRQ05_06235 [bacterium]|nr:MAG: hypothetical protein DRQ05_06235 [bacterium]